MKRARFSAGRTWVLALLTAGIAAGCREPPPPERVLPEPVRDPSWRDPTGADGPAESTTTVDDFGRPARLAAAPTAVEPAEPMAAVQASVQSFALEAFGLVADFPQPASAIAAGVGAGELWIYARALRGSAYGIEMRVQRRPVANLAELQAIAGEIGGQAVTASGEKAGRMWLRKASTGPVQSWWVALPNAGSDKSLAFVATCTGPPEYQAMVRRACLSLRREGEAAPAFALDERSP